MSVPLSFESRSNIIEELRPEIGTECLEPKFGGFSLQKNKIVGTAVPPLVAGLASELQPVHQLQSISRECSEGFTDVLCTNSELGPFASEHTKLYPYVFLVARGGQPSEISML
ncbi:hypothetical protein J1614_001966 [Plenodomus biglobosus]|nr:hypothetical protein J1614_001966 [Plenodomus biglobosus]